MINPLTRVSRQKDVVIAELDGKTVMMSLENGEYYGLDEVASAIWNGIEKPVTVSNLVNTLVKAYKVSVEQCQTDVLEFLEKLYNKQLIEIS